MTVCHLCNYALDDAEQAIRPAQGLTLALPAGEAATSVRWETPDGAERDLQVKMVDGRPTVPLPTLEIYALLIVRTP